VQDAFLVGPAPADHRHAIPIRFLYATPLRRAEVTHLGDALRVRWAAGAACAVRIASNVEGDVTLPDFGQRLRGDWPDKVRAEAELQEDGRLPLPAPMAGRDRFGGFSALPKTEATGSQSSPLRSMATATSAAGRRRASGTPFGFPLYLTALQARARLVAARRAQASCGPDAATRSAHPSYQFRMCAGTSRTCRARPWSSRR
jgi:hypothetical protein